MSDLGDKLLEIKRQKDEYILPENLKKDVTVYGITGTYEGSGGSGKIKLFNSIAEMNQDLTGNDGDIGVIYSYTEVEKTADGKNIDANALLLPETLDASLLSTTIKAWTDIHITQWGSQVQYYVDVILPSGSGGIGTDAGGNVFSVYGKVNSSDTYYTRGKGDYNKSTGQIFMLENVYPYDGDYKIEYIDITKNVNSPVWEQVKFLKIDTMVAYQFDAVLKRWSVLPTNYHLMEDEMFSGKKGLGMYGIVTGTIPVNDAVGYTMIKGINDTLMRTMYDANALVEANTNVLLNIGGFPTGFGDKRYFFSLMKDDMHGANHYRMFAGYWDDPDTTLYMPTANEIQDNSGNYYMPAKPFTYNRQINLDYDNIGPMAKSLTIKGIIDTVRITGFATEQGYNTVGHWNYDDADCWFATNCKIISKKNNVVVYEGGPKASDFYVGDYYTNIFGEKVDGTKSLPV